MKKKLILSWLTLMAITTTGLVFAKEERRDDGGDDEMAEEGEGREKGDGKGKGKGKAKGHPMAIRIFHHLDEDEDGALSRRELSKARFLEDESPGEIRKIFERKDLNDDGEIGPREWVRTFHPAMLGKGDKGPKGKGRVKGKGGKGGKGGGE